MAREIMCDDEECPRKTKCYRFNADIGPVQEWYKDSPRNKEDNSCDEFWEDK